MIEPALRRLCSWLPSSVVAPLREALIAVAPAPHAQPARAGPAAASYEALYEQLARSHPPDTAVGHGQYDLIGRIELGLLVMEGLTPTDTVLDFGCGTGRLAVQLIPRLAGGHYIGIDISDTMLANARTFIKRTLTAPTARVTWQKQSDDTFALPDASIDLMCAFSVFTHMEHEDSYRTSSLRGASCVPAGASSFRACRCRSPMRARCSSSRRAKS